MTLRFTKMHGTGNDFVVIDATRARFEPTPALLQRLTDRRFGVGCDQVLVVEAPSSPDVDFDYRIFNADGSEVGQCGNGARCLARFVVEQGLSDKSALRVRTRTAALELLLRDDGQVTVNMGVPRFEPDQIPFLEPARALRYQRAVDGQTLSFGAVGMGNPHLVMEVADIDLAPVETLGPRLEVHADFPQRVNVGFVQIVSRTQVRLRVFERGSGETLACGSGACAAVAVARLWDRVDERVQVNVRGGSLCIEWAGQAQPLRLTGPALTVFKGELAC
ncbi:diaminopimelate epimerase [Panacagrimonas sp.]|uniref:diaminopimelate epimerase n=1 Tax=Panacagrimonas sp. TaxID=2480088 RepID=UPI003B518FEF